MLLQTSCKKVALFYNLRFSAKLDGAIYGEISKYVDLYWSTRFMVASEAKSLSIPIQIRSQASASVHHGAICISAVPHQQAHGVESTGQS